MICRNCGTEYDSSPYCPVCNAPCVADRISDADKYVKTSNAVLPLSIVALALSTKIPFAGIIISCIAGSKLNDLPYIDEDNLVDTIFEQYKSAKTKIRIASKLKTIALFVSIGTMILNLLITLFYYIVSSTFDFTDLFAGFHA